MAPALVGPLQPRPRGRQQRQAARQGPVAAVLLLGQLGRLVAPGAWTGVVAAGARRPGRIARWAAPSAQPEAPALAARPTLELLKAQNAAGHAMKELGTRLQEAEFEALGLDGRVKAVYDGTQRLKRVEIGEGTLQSAGGEHKAMEQALLVAMQEAHDSSVAGTKGDVWRLYQENGQLLQAPLNQLGAGSTIQDVWANVTRTEETVRLAEELFARFDVDGDGYWNLTETSKVQMETEGTEMAEEAFNALIIAAAPDGGRKLSEEDLARGLSREQVVELYTDATRQRTLGFVLNIFKDYEKVFGSKGEEGKEASAVPAPAPAVD